MSFIPGVVLYTLKTFFARSAKKKKKKKQIGQKEAKLDQGSKLV